MKIQIILPLLLSSLLGQAAILSAAADSQVTSFQTPGSDIREQCIILDHFPEGEYSKKDSKREKELCSLDFYRLSTPVDSEAPAVGICAKINSTNPGVDILALPDGVQKAQFEESQCSHLKRTGKKIAKFKQSVSCSYTPSILGYYHLSRFLGGAANVPPAVLRTMSVTEHQKITSQGLKSTAGKSGQPAPLINQTWHTFASIEQGRSNLNAHNDIFTPDHNQIYGALSENPKKESKYLVGNRKLYAPLVAFTNTREFQMTINPKLVSETMPRTLPGAAQSIQSMTDVSNMLVMDYLMNQQDRFGNIHSLDFGYFQTASGEIQSQAWTEKTDDELKKLQAVPVKEMLLKDNDCGVAKDPIIKNAHLVEKISHMAPKTYNNVLKLAAAAETPELRAYFTGHLLYTARDYDDPVRGFKANAKSLKEILVGRCKAGLLHLDLDLNGVLKGTESKDSRAECDVR